MTWEGAVCERKDEPRGDIRREERYALFTVVSEVCERSYCQVFARRLLLFSRRIQNNPPSLQQSQLHASDSDGKRGGRGGSLVPRNGESDRLSNWD